jgi:glycosyltransferase involved in cell wall biosynthesis
MCGRNKFDIILSSCFSYAEKMKNYSIRSEWMPNAFPADLINVAPGTLREVCVGYCGTMGNEERQHYLSFLAGSIKMKCQIMVLGDAMASALGSYQISFNRNVGDDINYRTFESMGAGAMLLTNDMPGLEILFDIGKDCITYNTDIDALKKIQYYLENNAERLQIAENGYVKVHKMHTYDKRAERIVKLFEEVLG